MRQPPWVFHHVVSGPHALAGDRIGRLDASVRSAARRAKLPAEWASTRPPASTRDDLYCRGQAGDAVPKAMGHSSLTVTQRYVHLVDEHLDLLESTPRTARGR
ncbi:MAG: hypothetical protein ACT4P7_11805 [Gemmatimonadaceae bacterium]